MGYESKIYVVEKHNRTYKDREGNIKEFKADVVIDGKEYWWAEVIAVFDLCKCYAVSGKMRQYPATDCFIYADDGNTRITEDCYGDTLKEIPLEDAIAIIEEAATEDDYRRYTPCLMMLKGFDKGRWANLAVLHFGH